LAGACVTAPGGFLAVASLAKDGPPLGAAQLQEFHRQLFNRSADVPRQEIKRITCVEVREAVAVVEPTTGTMVQVFLLADNDGRV
jgi:hypothetical protein